jgi:hypothetical protein
VVNKQHTYPFPLFPAIPWTEKQIKEYEKQQRQQLPDAPMVSNHS